VAYVVLFIDPAIAGLIGVLISMGTRQSGHFFFEPLGFDEVNQVTNEYKEQIKVGFNLHRKIAIIAIWAISPIVLYLFPGLFGVFPPASSAAVFIHQTGWIWFSFGVGGLLFRTIHLFFLKDVKTGLVWMTKILTDPFHDIKQYYDAPLALLRGELLERITADKKPA
jgi:hypothetical protein